MQVWDVGKKRISKNGDGETKSRCVNTVTIVFPNGMLTGCDLRVGSVHDSTVDARFGPEHEHGFNACLYADKGFAYRCDFVHSEKSAFTLSDISGTFIHTRLNGVPICRPSFLHRS